MSSRKSSKPVPVLEASPLIVRPWRASDLKDVVRNANNSKIWLNLRDRFPHPFTVADARAWLAIRAADSGNPHNFAIEFEGGAIGGIGFKLGTDIARMSAEMGYWLGEPFWGRGFATIALRAVTGYAFASFNLERIQATVYEWNPASVRVLEKAEYQFEGRLRNYVMKDGRLGDVLMYAKLRPD